MIVTLVLTGEQWPLIGQIPKLKDFDAIKKHFAENDWIDLEYGSFIVANATPDGQMSLKLLMATMQKLFGTGHVYTIKTSAVVAIAQAEDDLVKSFKGPGGPIAAYNQQSKIIRAPGPGTIHSLDAARKE